MTDGPSLAGLVERVAACLTPVVIGVRHHSPACSAAIPALLDRFRPDLLMVELPADLQSWIPWVGHEALEPPVALAATRSDGQGLFFYPFASFSPELVAIRWAIRHRVPVEAFDLPVGRREARCCGGPGAGRSTPSLVEAALRQSECPDTEALWERLVEARGLGDEPERVRRGALAFGLLLREDSRTGPGIPASDEAREAHMRERLAAALADPAARVVAVVGAFHAAALVEAAGVTGVPPGESAHVRTSLIPYAFELLDSRSGYPAGIRDPMWQERALLAAGRGELDGLAAGVIVEVARRVRGAGLAAGFPDEAEAVRLARGLAALRGLAGPGRREVLEAITSTMAQGEPLGRGRVLARALEHVMVGARRGRLAPDTPRSGLAPAVEALLAELRLPVGPDPVEMVLDPLRSDLDRRRHVTLERLGACGVPYGRRVDRSRFVDAETLTVRWSLQHTPATAAMLDLAGIYGVTLEQAAAGALAERERKLELEDRVLPAVRLAGAEQAAECGLAALAVTRLVRVVDTFAREAPLAELLEAVLLVERVACGHVPGMIGVTLPPEACADGLLAAAVRAVEGVSGSTRPEDARALFDLVRLLEMHPTVGEGRLVDALGAMARDGAPPMQGAAAGVLALLGQDRGALPGRVGSWIDGATTPELRSAMTGRFRGLLLGAALLFESVPVVITQVHERLVALDDGEFLDRLPSLRDGFEVLSSAARGRLLAAVGDLVGDGPLPDTVEYHPALLAAWAAADRAGLDALARLGLGAPPREAPSAANGGAWPACAPQPDRSRTISPLDRWRLVLGQERRRMGEVAARLEVSLEELYGQGTGEGSRAMTAAGGGQERAFPTAREWAGELEALFGTQVRDEVLGKAAQRGSPAAALELDPGSVQPSVELLQQILALKGGLGEAQVARLRPLVARIVASLVDALASRVRPALTGLVSSRPSSRPSGPIDLRRTLARNLRTARRTGDGVRVVAERPVFRARARRSLDWHVQLVVDVSGSMEPSVIYSALMAAILGALPALTVRFLAFNTEVIDLSERVDDPLGLLLEVQIGGGTSIGKAVRFARETLTVPSRTMVVVVSDFEEGLSVGTLVSEVRALVETGARALGVAALDDRGKPRYNRALAELLVEAGMPVAALTPLELARWIADQVR